MGVRDVHEILDVSFGLRDEREQRCSQEAVCQLDLEHMDDTHEDGNPVHASIMPASSSHKQAASFQTVAKGSIGTGLLVQAPLSCTNM